MAAMFDNIFSTNHNIFCLFDSYSDEILFSAFLSTKCQEQSNILEKQNGKRVCVKDEWKCLLLLYIIISLFCLT